MRAALAAAPLGKGGVGIGDLRGGHVRVAIRAKLLLRFREQLGVFALVPAMAGGAIPLGNGRVRNRLRASSLDLDVAGCAKVLFLTSQEVCAADVRVVAGQTSA